MRTAFSTVLGVALVGAPLLACPVCGLASASNNQSSYVSMSLLLSVLPLGMMTGMAVWLYRRHR